MDFEKLCAERYSLRKFSGRPVEAEKLEKVLEAGHNAPTAHNLQPQRILVMQSKEALEKAEECTACKFHPPVILVVAYDPAKAWNREGDMKNHSLPDPPATPAPVLLLPRSPVLLQYHRQDSTDAVSHLFLEKYADIDSVAAYADTLLSLWPDSPDRDQ